MMKLIGAKRLFILFVLLGMNVILGTAYFMSLSPMLDETQAQLAGVDAEISDLSSKLMDSKQEMAYMQENMPKYKKLEEQGLFQIQDRFMMSRWLEDMRNKAQLTSFSFSINDLAEIPNQDAAEIEKKLVSSTINVNVRAVPFDTGIYAFLQDISSAFPIYTRVRSFTLKRSNEVNRSSLDLFARNSIQGFIEANVVFDWLSVIPKDVVPSEPQPASMQTPPGVRGR